MSRPIKGTLWTVLTYGLSISELEISDTMISDHKPILLSLLLPNLPSPSGDGWLSRSYSSQFHLNFNLLFNELSSQLSLDSSLSDLNVDQHLELLNNAWLEF